MTRIYMPATNSHQEHVGTVIQELEDKIKDKNNQNFSAQPSPTRTHSEETPGAVPVAMKRYLDEAPDEEGVVVYTRSHIRR